MYFSVIFQDVYARDEIGHKTAGGCAGIYSYD